MHRPKYRWIDALQLDAAFCVWVLIVLAIVTPLAWLATKVIEQPMDRLGRGW